MKVDKEYVSETINATGKNLFSLVKKLIHQGNIRKLIIKDKNDRVILEFPLTFGVVGAAIAPFLMIVATLGVLISECVIYIEKDPEVPVKKNNDSEVTEDIVE